MAEKAKTRSKSKKPREGANAPSEEEIQKFLDELHEEADQMEEEGATRRGNMARIYDKATDKLGMTKAAFKIIYRRQRRDRKDEATVAKMDTRDREAIQKASQAFGDTTPFGAWLADISHVPQQDPEPVTE